LITDNTKGLLSEDINILDANIEKLKNMVENTKKIFKSKEEVKKHYEKTLKDMSIATKSAPFITVWQTSSTDNNITIPINPDYKDDYNYTVDWGDGNITNNINDNITHVYSSVGEHTVKISGAFPAMRMVIKNNIPLIDEERKNNAKQLQKVTQWGDIEWRSFNKTFALCNNLDVNAIDTPNLSDVNSTRGMFWDASALKGNEYFNKWDVSNITTMESMFQQATNFNQPLTNWNVSNVTNMKLMFNFAESFNQPLNSWNVSNVTNMFAMFSSASSFNQPLNDWNVSKVTDMTFMFAGARAFSDQNLSSWDISSVESGKNGNFIDGAGDRNIQPNWN
jgi:surface protein